MFGVAPLRPTRRVTLPQNIAVDQAVNTGAPVSSPVNRGHPCILSKRRHEELTVCIMGAHHARRRWTATARQP